MRDQLLVDPDPLGVHLQPHMMAKNIIGAEDAGDACSVDVNDVIHGPAPSGGALSRSPGSLKSKSKFRVSVAAFAFKANVIKKATDKALMLFIVLPTCDVI